MNIEQRQHRIIEVHNKIDISSRQRFTPFLEGLQKNKVFSVSAKKKEGLEALFEGIEKALFNKRIQEDIILGVNESEKIKWLYQKRLVKASEFRENTMNLAIIWDSDERQKFNETFVETVL